MHLLLSSVVFSLSFASTLAQSPPTGGPELRFNKCSPALSASQQWTLRGPASNGTLTLTSSLATLPYCLDIEDFDTSAGAAVWSFPCGKGSKLNENFDVGPTSITSRQIPPTCLVANMASVGARVTTAECSATDPLQALSYSSTTGLITLGSGDSQLCVDANATYLPYPPWCSGLPQSGWAVCDPKQGLDARAADIVGRLSPDDKIAALVTATKALPSVGLPPYQWWSEATHGLGGPGVHHSTALPGASNTALPITTSCSFNRTMWGATGNLIGREARAFINAGLAGSTFWTPVINIVRDPRWGRNIESAGEDPFLSGQYAANFIQGFEHAKETSYPLQASTCCKHFVGNELEAWNGTNRNHVDVFIPQQDLADSYLPSFQTCVEEGKASGIMCSYNAVNGVPSCANNWLLSDVLRGAWEFDGYVTSDCDADNDVWASHHYTATPEEAVRDILRAGTDVDCGSFMTQHAASALANGNITVDDIDTVLLRLFRVRLRLGHFETKTPLDAIGAADVCTDAGRELARDGGRQSIVLVKNDKGLLPLSPASFSKALMIGPNLNLTNTINYYGSNPCPNQSAVPFDSLLQHIPSATAILGVPSVGSTDTSGIAAAATAAAGADLIILSVGSNRDLETEGHDRLVIAFSDAQLALITAVTAAAKCPIVALVQSGGAMDISPLLANPGIGAILVAGQPSVQIVGAGDIIFGRTLDGRPVAPAARMSQMTYPADYVNQVSMFEFSLRPGTSAWPPGTTPGRTYRFYTGTPVLPFGYGLSYTTWVYTPLPDPAPPATTITSALHRTVSLGGVEAAATAQASNGVTGNIPAGLKDVAAQFWVNVTNSGSVDSDDVVLGFMTPPGAGTNGVPLKELFGFERVFVPAGQTVTVYLGAQGVRFTQVDKEGVRRVVKGEYTVSFGVEESANLGMGFAQVKVLAQ